VAHIDCPLSVNDARVAYLALCEIHSLTAPTICIHLSMKTNYDSSAQALLYLLQSDAALVPILLMMLDLSIRIQSLARVAITMMENAVD